LLVPDAVANLGGHDGVANLGGYDGVANLVANLVPGFAIPDLGGHESR
jgi:hypothetical protein